MISDSLLWFCVFLLEKTAEMNKSLFEFKRMNKYSLKQVLGVRQNVAFHPFFWWTLCKYVKANIFTDTKKLNSWNRNLLSGGEDKKNKNETTQLNKKTPWNHDVFSFLTLFKTYAGLIFHLYPSSQDVVLFICSCLVLSIFLLVDPSFTEIECDRMITNKCMFLHVNTEGSKHCLKRPNSPMFLKGWRSGFCFLNRR